MKDVGGILNDVLYVMGSLMLMVVLSFSILGTSGRWLMVLSLFSLAILYIAIIKWFHSGVSKS